MRIAFGIVLLTIAAVPAAAEKEQPRGIDCARAATRLEKLTCSDPVLKDYDSRIAAAYARNLAEWNGAIAAYVRREQREWLGEYRTIEKPLGEIDPPCAIDDRDCIRGYVLQRVDAIESGAYPHSGAYRRKDGMTVLIHPRRANGFALTVFPAGNAAQVARTLENDQDTAGKWDGPTTMIAPLGDGNGLPRPRGQACTLRIATEPLAITVSQTGRCNGLAYAGRYARDLTQTLRNFELSLD